MPNYDTDMYRRRPGGHPGAMSGPPGSGFNPGMGFGGQYGGTPMPFAPPNPANPSMGSALYQLAMQQMGPDIPHPGPLQPHGGRPPLPAPSGGSLGDRIVGGLSDFGGGALRFLGGNDGANALMAANLGLSAYDAHRQRSEYERDRERREELEEEQRRRYDANAPVRGSMLAGFTGRL